MARRHSLVPRVEAQIARYQTVNRENGRITILGAAALLALVIAAGVLWYVYGRSGHILDEALAASPARDAASFQAADEDYFHDMDQDRNGPVALSR